MLLLLKPLRPLRRLLSPPQRRPPTSKSPSRLSLPVHLPRAAAAMGSVAGDAVRLAYPPVRRDASVVDDYHGAQIPDPYRWLEDPDSEETKEFVAAQAELAESVLTGCGHREGLRSEVTRLFDHPRHAAPFRRGDKYFHFHNSGLQAQSVLYVQDDLEGETEVLLDPNTLSKDGTVALSTYSISEDGKYIAYGLSESGSDWITIRVMRIADREPMPDKLSWVKFSSISWTHDGKGFFYGRYPAPGVGVDAGTETNINLNHQVYYHVMGSDQSEDILCWKDPENPKHSLGASVTEDGKIRDLITGNLLHQLPLEIGSVSEISCRREDKEVFIGFTSSLSPGIIYRCILASTIPEMKTFREN